MIQLNNVEKMYPGFKLEADLQIPVGTITGIIGVNGSGKSTLFRLILGLEKADRGDIEVFETDVDKLSAKQKAKIGAVFPDSGFNGVLDPKAVGKILARFYPDFSLDEYNKLCQRLSVKMDQRLEKMSTGQRARAKLAAALAHHPELLILDEPTSGLDVVARNDILGVLQTYMETPGRSILISSHIASDLESLCDDVYLIHEGKLRFHDEVGSVLDEYGLLSLSDKQVQEVDLRGVVGSFPTTGGVKVLVRDRNYYRENYPELVVDKPSLDHLIELYEYGKAEK